MALRQIGSVKQKEIPWAKPRLPRSTRWLINSNMTCTSPPASVHAQRTCDHITRPAMHFYLIREAEQAMSVGVPIPDPPTAWNTVLLPSRILHSQQLTRAGSRAVFFSRAATLLRAATVFSWCRLTPSCESRKVGGRAEQIRSRCVCSFAVG